MTQHEREKLPARDGVRPGLMGGPRLVILNYEIKAFFGGVLLRNIMGEWVC